MEQYNFIPFSLNRSDVNISKPKFMLCYIVFDESYCRITLSNTMNYLNQCIKSSQPGVGLCKLAKPL